MSRELAKDILKAVQNASNHFVASKTAKVGSTIRLTHPVGKAIFAQALTPLSGSCLVFEQNGQWFAVAGAERTETNSTTVVSRRSRPRGKTATEFEVAYLFIELVDDGSELPFVRTLYDVDPEKMMCHRKPFFGGGYDTPEDCQNFSTFSTLDAPFNNYFKRIIFRHNRYSAGYSNQDFTEYAYNGDNSNAFSNLSNAVSNNFGYSQITFVKSSDPTTPDIYEDENYLIIAQGNTDILLVYQRFVEGNTALQYILVSYNMTTGEATGTKYCKSTSNYTDYQGNQIVAGQFNFPLPHTTDQILAFAGGNVDSRLNEPNRIKFNQQNPSLAINVSCSYANLNFQPTVQEVEPFAQIYNELYDVSNRVATGASFTFVGTGTILGSVLEAGSVSASVTASGSVPSSVDFATSHSGASAGGIETFYYAGYLSPGFARSYIVTDFKGSIFSASIHQQFKTGKIYQGRIDFYLQKKNEQPIKVLELPQGEGFEAYMSSSLTKFNILIKVGGYSGGYFRVFLIDVPINNQTPNVEVYNFLDNDVVPVPEDNWLKLYYNFVSKFNVEFPADSDLTDPDNLALASTFPYWHFSSPTQYFFSKALSSALYFNMNINTLDFGKSLFYFEVLDLIDTDPIVYIEPLPEPIFLSSGTLTYIARRNRTHLISAFFTGRFSNARLWKVTRLPDEEQVEGELFKYSTPQALPARLYPLNVGIDLTSSTIEEIESAINRYSLVAIISYLGVVTKKTFVSQEVNFPLVDVFGGD